MNLDFSFCEQKSWFKLDFSDLVDVDHPHFQGYLIDKNQPYNIYLKCGIGGNNLYWKYFWIISKETRPFVWSVLSILVDTISIRSVRSDRKPSPQSSWMFSGDQRSRHIWSSIRICLHSIFVHFQTWKCLLFFLIDIFYLNPTHFNCSFNILRW